MPFANSRAQAFAFFDGATTSVCSGPRKNARSLPPTDCRPFTAPHLPIGWNAVFPTKAELGTVVRVR